MTQSKTQAPSLELARRMHKLPPYVFGKLNASKLARRRAGEDIIDLGMGNPNDPTPQPIVDKLCDAVQDPRNHRYSKSAAGIRNLKKEVARFYKDQWGVNVDAEDEVVATIGSKEGISHLSLALIDPDDAAIVPTPAFPPHSHSVSLAGGDVLSPELSTDQSFWTRVEKTIHEAETRPKVLFLNFPHNPSTATVDRSFYETAVDFAHEHDLFIVHDFAYSHITFDGYEAPSFLEIDGAKEVGVEFTSMSKSFNMAGWRVGFCVVLRLRTVHAGSDSHDHRPAPLPGRGEQTGQDLRAAAGRAVRRAEPNRLAGRETAGHHVRLGPHTRTVQGRRYGRFCHENPRRGQRRCGARRRVRAGRPGICTVGPGRERIAPETGSKAAQAQPEARLLSIQMVTRITRVD